MPGRNVAALLAPMVAGQQSTRLTSSGVVSSQAGFLSGVFVASGSSPTILFYDNASAASGTTLVNTFTPTTGWNPCPIPFANGLYATIGGTIDASFIFS